MNRTSFPPKLAVEATPLVFDFTSILGTDTIASVSPTTVAVYSGVDPLPAAILSGLPFFSGALVTQKVVNGVPGVIYELVSLAAGGLGSYALAAYLYVLPATP
jgi:hypothetical protein